jgi:zinc D-Ala-D-Ala dipeptidase
LKFTFCIFLFIVGCSSSPLNLNKISCESIAPSIRNSRQLIVFIANDWQTPHAKLHRFERSRTGEWHSVGSIAEAHLGKNGLGWGRGVQHVYGESSPEFIKMYFRVEGDNKSPAGVFTLGATFGTHRDVEHSERMKKQSEYIPVQKGLQCSDDSHSKFYNQFVVQSDYDGAVAIEKIPQATAKEIIDSEDMYAAADPSNAKYGQWLPYQLGIFVNHNRPVVPGAPPYGSCIFIHVMNPNGSGTSGCASLSYADLKDLVAWRDPVQNPLLIILPEDEWHDLSARCEGLPKNL